MKNLLCIALVVVGFSAQALTNKMMCEGLGCRGKECRNSRATEGISLTHYTEKEPDYDVVQMNADYLSPELRKYLLDSGKIKSNEYVKTAFIGLNGKDCKTIGAHFDELNCLGKGYLNLDISAWDEATDSEKIRYLDVQNVPVMILYNPSQSGQDVHQWDISVNHDGADKPAVYFRTLSSTRCLHGSWE